jgi:hypothetical protein
MAADPRITPEKCRYINVYPQIVLHIKTILPALSANGKGGNRRKSGSKKNQKLISDGKRAPLIFGALLLFS